MTKCSWRPSTNRNKFVKQKKEVGPPKWRPFFWGRRIPRRASNQCLVEADFEVGALLEMDGFDEAHLALVQSEDHGGGANALAEEPHSFQKIAVGHAGTGKDHFLAGREVVGVVDALGIHDPHFFKARLVLRFAYHQPREDLAVQTAQSRGGENAFGSSAGPHHHVHTSANNSGGNSRREIAIADEPDARARGANIRDELFVAWAIENDH